MRYWLKRIREEKNMSQDLVSREAGIAQGYYSDIENGVKGCKLPVETAKKIAYYVGLATANTSIVLVVQTIAKALSNYYGFPVQF